MKRRQLDFLIHLAFNIEICYIYLHVILIVFLITSFILSSSAFDSFLCINFISSPSALAPSRRSRILTISSFCPTMRDMWLFICARFYPCISWTFSICFIFSVSTVAKSLAFLNDSYSIWCLFYLRRESMEVISSCKIYPYDCWSFNFCWK